MVYTKLRLGYFNLKLNPQFGKSTLIDHEILMSVITQNQNNEIINWKNLM